MLLHDNIVIAATPEAVWAVTVDVLRWPDWTPTVTAIRSVDDKTGLIEVGDRFHVIQPNQPAAVWEVLRLEPPHLFMWERIDGTAPLIATHRIDQIADGTQNRTEFDLGGMLVKLLGPFMAPSLRKVLRTENEALKRHCEGH